MVFLPSNVLYYPSDSFISSVYKGFILISCILLNGVWVNEFNDMLMRFSTSTVVMWGDGGGGGPHWENQDFQQVPVHCQNCICMTLVLISNWQAHLQRVMVRMAWFSLSGPTMQSSWKSRLARSVTGLLCVTAALLVYNILPHRFPGNLVRGKFESAFNTQGNISLYRLRHESEMWLFLNLTFHISTRTLVVKSKGVIYFLYKISGTYR